MATLLVRALDGLLGTHSSSTASFSGQTATPSPASPSLAIGPGEPSPGAPCMGPSCWERSTSRYGLRRLPLCPACAKALAGEVYQRPGAERARAIGRTAA